MRRLVGVIAGLVAGQRKSVLTETQSTQRGTEVVARRSRVGARARWLIGLAGVLAGACASEAPVAPPPSTICELGGDVGLQPGSGCARAYGEVSLASGRKLPYGSVVAWVPFDTSSPTDLAYGEGRLTAANVFSVQVYIFGQVRLPGDSVRVMLYARSPYWDFTPFDSVPVTLHIARTGDRLRIDTVRIVSSANPRAY